MPRILELKEVGTEIWVRIDKSTLFQGQDHGSVSLWTETEINRLKIGVRNDLLQQFQEIVDANNRD